MNYNKILMSINIIKSCCSPLCMCILQPQAFKVEQTYGFKVKEFMNI